MVDGFRGSGIRKTIEFYGIFEVNRLGRSSEYKNTQRTYLHILMYTKKRTIRKSTVKLSI